MSQQNGSGGLSREQILAAIDLKIEAVEVPEWSGVVYVRAMSGKMRDAFEHSRYRLVNDKVEVIQTNVRASLLAASICDSQGTLLFTKEDIEALGEKNGAVLDRLFDVAQRLSGLRTPEQEERLKNLRAAQSAVSGSN